MSPKAKTDTELWCALEGLDDDLLDPALPTDIVADELRKLGLDPVALAKMGSGVVAQLQEQERLSWRAKALEKRARLEGRGARVTVPAGMSKAAMLARLEELRSSHPRMGTAVVAAFRKRKPEESTDEELRGLLEDMELLRSIEDDEEEE